MIVLKDKIEKYKVKIKKVDEIYRNTCVKVERYKKRMKTG